MDFQADLPVMNRFNQRYFGDWVDYCGRADVGYYLGARFVQDLCSRYDFGQLIRLEIEEVTREFFRFAEENHACDDNR